MFMDSKPVVLVMNGEYIGFYELCEHKRVGETRIPVFDWEGLGRKLPGRLLMVPDFPKGYFRSGRADDT